MTSSASQKLKFQFVFSCLVVVVALGVTGLILNESPPFDNFFSRHSDITDAWRMTALIPFIFSAMISGNPHSPPLGIFILALIIQWSLVGFLLSIPTAKLWARLRKK